LFNALRRGSLAAELLMWLRAEFGTASAWSVALSAQPPTRYPDTIADQETLLGDYLRLVQEHLRDPEQPLELNGCLECPTQELPESIWRLEQPAARQQVLREAAALGVQLLQGDDP
jgi:hypothetical protein